MESSTQLDLLKQRIQYNPLIFGEGMKITCINTAHNLL